MKLFGHFRHYRGEANHLPDQIRDDRLIEYLLGGLGRKEQAILEQQYFQNDDRFEYLRAIEDELIDRYLRGELSVLEHRQFERHFLASPVRRERVHSARALMEVVTPGSIAAPRRNRWEIHWKSLAWSFACAMLVFTTSLSWLVWKNISLRSQLAVARRDLEHRDAAVQNSLVPPSAPLTLSFVLAPVQRDVGSPNRLIVPAEAQVLNFSVDAPPSGRAAYRAIFRTPDGDQVGASADITIRPSPGGISTEIGIPAAAFSPGTYILTLQASRPASGFQDVKSYSFTIARR